MTEILWNDPYQKVSMIALCMGDFVWYSQTGQHKDYDFDTEICALMLLE
jgi:hypothetical protein